MAKLELDEGLVNQALSELDSATSELGSVDSEISSAINAILSARGIEYVDTSSIQKATGLSEGCNQLISNLKSGISERVEEIKKYNQTIILYEAPHKLINTLKMMLEEIGDRNICLAREITKIHEEHIRGKISEILEKINEPKGEYVLILEGNNKSEKEEKREILNEMSLEEHFEYYKKQGFDKKEIIKKIAKDRNTNKNEIYQYFLK